MSEAARKVKLFENQQVRTKWDEQAGKWWFSVVDVVAVLTEQPDYTRARKYWSVLKTRLKQEGSQLATNCSQLKLTAADGKKYLTDVADTEQILRPVQSIPSKKAEPPTNSAVKHFLATAIVSVIEGLTLHRVIAGLTRNLGFMSP